MSAPSETRRVLERLTKAVQAYLDSDVIVDAMVARELRLALLDGQAVIRKEDEG